MADSFEARKRAELDQFLAAPEAAPTRPDGTPGPTPAPAAPTAPKDEPGPPEGAITYGWRVGKQTFGVGVHDVLDGLNDMYNGPSQGGRSSIRGAAKVIGGLFKMGLSPVAGAAGSIGDTLDKFTLTQPLMRSNAVTNPNVAGPIRVALDPFGAVGMMLESPESLAAMTDEQRAAFQQKAADYGAPFTVREAVETAASMAMVIAAAHKISGAGKEPAKPGETAKPAAETKPPVSDVPKVEPAAAPAEAPKAAKPQPWQMGSDELAAAERAAKADEKNAGIEVFGAEKAAEYERLQREANSPYDFKKADAASDKIAAMESALTEQQQARLFGTDDPSVVGADVYRDFRQAVDRIGGDTPAELGDSLKWAVTKLGDVTDPAKMTTDQQIGYAQLRRGMEIAQERGWDTKDVSTAALKGAARRFRDPEDAAYMLQGFLKKRPQPAEPAALSASTEAPKATPEAAIKDKLPPITDEEAMAFAQRVNAEPPPEVPPPGTEGPRVFGVNWQRLGQEESVKRVVLDVNKTLTEGGQSAEAARGVRSHETTTEAAKGVGLTVEDVLKLEPGTAVNAETMTALRGVRDVAARKLMTAAEFAKAGDLAARGDLPTIIALNHEINLRVKGATAEAGRTLESMKMPSDLETSGTSMLDFQNLVDKISNMQDIDKAASMVTALSDRPGAVRQFMNNLGRAAKTGKDIIWELYVNSLLSGPKTLAKKVLSDGLRAGWEIPERAIARFNHQLFFRSDPTGVASGEVGAMARGLAEGAIDAVRMIGTKEADLGTALGESHPFPKALTAENLGLQDTPVARAVNLMGDIVRTPGTAIGYATDLAKAANYGMEMKAQAVRQAKFEGRTGADFTRRVGYIEENPGEFPQIADAAKQAALVNTFTQEMGPRGQGLAAFLNDWGGRAVVPFLRVPWNITKFSVQSVVGPLSSEFRQAWSLGGAARETALAQWQMGAMVAAGTAYLVTQGRITGDWPKDASLRETRRELKIPAYSLKIGDFWYGYHTSEPLGGIIGLAADFTQLWGQLPDEGEPFDKAMETGASIAMAFGRSLQHKPYFTGLKDVFDALMGPDKKAEALARSWAKALVPAGVRQFDQAVWDGIMREARTPLQAMQSVTPGYSDSLPPHRSQVTGTVFEYPPALGPAIASPWPMMEERGDPVLSEFNDNGIRYPRIPDSISGTPEPFIQMNGAAPPQIAPLDVWQKDRWIVLQTSERIAGRTLYETLERLIASPKYQALPKGPESDARQLEVGLVFRAYREKARQQVLREYPDLAIAARARERETLTNRLPTTNPRSTGIPALTPSLGR